MDFDMSKENIQPLRGGRNRAQLEVALQAQDDTELHKELLQTKLEFENSIRTYEGDDPLDNWYSYISWVEQSFPKHGHEGNLIKLLEDCLGKFEKDERYMHDRRLCKLWIKYIDLLQNPDELFQLLHSKGICVSCADLYRAWAFYHEIAGDFKRANAVYQLGIQAMAQPYEELVIAQKNMFMAAGRQMVQEDGYEQQMAEQRQALTSLRTYKHRSTVPSTRVGHQVLRRTPGTMQVPLKSSTKSNVLVDVYVDENDDGLTKAAPSETVKSILDVARRQETIKENTLKPGPWTKLKQKKRAPGGNHHLTPSFKVHEDEVPVSESLEMIHLYPNFITSNLDDFSDWKTKMFIEEPEDNKKIPMYPKHLVYANNQELNLEEVIAQRYLVKKLKGLSISLTSKSTDAAMPEHLSNTVNNEEKNQCVDNKFTIFEENEAYLKQVDTEDRKEETKNIPKETGAIKKVNLKKPFQIFSDVHDNTSNLTRTKITEQKLVDVKPDEPMKDKIFTVYEDEASGYSPQFANDFEVPVKNLVPKKAFDIFTDDDDTFARPKDCNFAKGPSLIDPKKLDKPKTSFSIYADDDTELPKQSTSQNKIEIFQDDFIPEKLLQKPKTGFSIYDESEQKISKGATKKVPKISSSVKKSRGKSDSLYKEENVAILSKDGNFSLTRDKSNRKMNDNLKEHVRSLIQPKNDTPKISFSIPRQ